VKLSVLKRVLPPNNNSVRSVSRETGINPQTIHNWLKKSKLGILTPVTGDKSPLYFSSMEKLHVLLETSGLGDEDLGRYLREHGIHSQHLTLWNQELRELVSNKDDKKNKKLKELTKRVRYLEKELSRKEKALAETAALLVLKKKLDNLFEDSEDD